MRKLIYDKEARLTDFAVQRQQHEAEAEERRSASKNDQRKSSAVTAARKGAESEQRKC